jgi:hypothetical protein
MRRFLVLPLLVAICPSFSAVADEWGWPHPVSFHLRGFGYVAKVFPPGSRQNPDKKPLCYFYEMGYPGTSWKNAKYYFLEKPARRYVTLPWGKVLEFNLDTGRFRYEPAARFSDLAKVLAKGNDTKEQAEIWETSLRFSSVSDVVQAKGKQSVP